MVRVNLIPPRKLADQHLVAEYAEILMLIKYIKKHPQLEGIPKKYCLGTGHQKFFKDKVLYLKKRHEKLREEMKRRGYTPNHKLSLTGLKQQNKKDYRPNKEAFDIIKKRLLQKLKLKPTFYKYYGEKKPLAFYKKLLSN